MMGEACGTGGGGSGGGGSGGCGGEAIGVAVEASSGCCCVVPVDGSPGSCKTVGDPSECSYQVYTDGACSGSPLDTDTGGCSASGVRSGAGGANAVEVSVLLLALAVFRPRRRRFARG
jgi:hypothetical protein